MMKNTGKALRHLETAWNYLYVAESDEISAEEFKEVSEHIQKAVDSIKGICRKKLAEEGKNAKSVGQKCTLIWEETNNYE